MTIWNTEILSPQKTLTIIIVHLHSNIDSLVQRNCLVLYFDKEVFIFYNIIYSAVSRASSAMRETSIPGRERLSRNSVEKVQLLLLFCDYMVYRLNLCLLLYCYQICTYENNEKWVNSFILGISHLINYWNKSFKNLLIFVFFIDILQWI